MWHKCLRGFLNLVLFQVMMGLWFSVWFLRTGCMTITDTAFLYSPALNTHQCDVLNLGALAAMVLDHLNTASGLNDTLLQAVGRLAFPMFALVWGSNIVRRPVTQAGLNRLWLPFRHSGVEWWQSNILFTFAVMGQAVHFMQTPCNRTAFVSLLTLCLYIPVSGASYELRGLLLLLMSSLFFLRSELAGAGAFSPCRRGHDGWGGQ
ncbi:hypothetical protein J3951_004598 [Salmonella enterica subsp. enterica serovar Typhimurium]|nr:hypothetical protein [Salmonella enterica subsp. enterica serovar Typhimurium]